MPQKRNPDWDKIEAEASKRRRVDTGGTNSKSQKSPWMAKMRAMLAKKEMTIQRMSVEMTGGRTPKYMNIGPREFVPYPYDEFTIKNLRASCIAHYSGLDPIVQNYGCNVEASYEGPVCSNVDQIPDPSKILVRFIPKQNESIKVPNFSKETERKISIVQSVQSLLPPPPVKKSLSLSEMIRVGHSIQAESTSIKIKDFDLHNGMWDDLGTVNFNVVEPAFGHGAFRDVYNITSKNPLFSKKKWVLKRYNEQAKCQVVDEKKQTLEEHTKTAVQMVNLSGYFAKKLGALHQDLRFSFVKTYYGELIDKNGIDYVTLEEKLDGNFVKYTNNDGTCPETENDFILKAYCLAHFSFQASEEKLLLTDIQGCGHSLTDPEIASSEYMINQKSLFCVGNFCRKAIKSFGLQHTCNKYCKFAKLNPLDRKKFEDYDDKIEIHGGVTI